MFLVAVAARVLQAPAVLAHDETEEAGHTAPHQESEEDRVSAASFVFVDCHHVMFCAVE